ncbi:retinoic acid-induced protein 2 [Erpetoichthys calabaricus]|uniref:Retinoic acid induced 2 n=1 Tax=Erpetoichthys calabaricus TaxID=27687 RepID=A0A8C4RIJ5_ERPCA|nr:retinoic acid-induced protein 2 [Erpetoichthys calabaricus]
MEDLYKDDQAGMPLDMTTPQTALATSGGGGVGGNGKLENGMTQLITAEAWNINPTGLMKKALSPLVAVPAPPMVTPPTESSGGVALKVAATVLQPICLGDSPVMLPIHLQAAGSTAPQINPSGNTSYIMTNQGPVPLPIVLEQHMFQHLNSPVLPQGVPCPTISLQNNVLCQNSSVSFGQPPSLDQKPSNQTQDPGILPLFQNPGFTTILQDLFPPQNNLGPSTCPSTNSAPADNFSSNFFTPPIPQAYSSPLSPLVPPAILLVPYPVIVPLPVPVPIPIPVPIPVPQCSDSKAFSDSHKPTCTTNKSTQTGVKEALSPQHQPHRDISMQVSQITGPPATDGEVLDLSFKTLTLPTKQEIPFQQDSILDLSVSSVRKRSFPVTHCDNAKDPSRGLPVERPTCSGEQSSSSALSLDVLRPTESSQKVDSKLLNGLASVEFSRQHKWVVDPNSNRPGCDPKCGGNNIEIVSTSQTAKVIVSVKDAVPAIFCGKIKGLSGVSTKNFSFKRDSIQESMLQQCYDVKGQAEQRDSSDMLKKPLKSRSVKLKKVNSQEIHILPIKKQRLAAFFPRK